MFNGYNQIILYKFVPLGLFWTAPELLRLDHHGSHGYQPVGRDGMSQEGDVYACAVILKELFSRSGPYTEYDEMDPSGKHVL